MKSLGEIGGGAPGAPPLDPPLGCGSAGSSSKKQAQRPMQFQSFILEVCYIQYIYSILKLPR